MAEVEKKAPGLPEEVPKDLRMELERLQRQIKVLLNNYQVGETLDIGYEYDIFPNPKNFGDMSKGLACVRTVQDNRMEERRILMLGKETNASALRSNFKRLTKLLLIFVDCC